MTCVRMMIVGTSAEQLRQLGRSIGDILISPSAGPDHGGPVEASTRLIQFGRIVVDDALALHLYVVSGHRRFAFMWSVLGRDMRGCLVLVEPESEDSVANAREVLGAVAESGVSAVVLGVTGDAVGLKQAAERLGLRPDTSTVSCQCGDRDSVRRALCAVLRRLPTQQAVVAIPRDAGVSVPVGVL